MADLKSPMLIAGIVITTVFIVVIVMMYRTVSSLKSSVFSVVEQHNNAKGILDNHESTLKRIEDVLIAGDDEYDDEDEDGMCTDEQQPTAYVQAADHPQPATKKSK